MAKQQQSDLVTPLLAGLLAWLVPGAGHVYLRRPVRGVILCLCITGLFWTGVAIGGVFTVEPIRERWWYAGQMCTGISGIAAWYRQGRQRKDVLDDYVRSHRPGEVRGLSYEDFRDVLAQKGLALSHPADVVARAYSGIAGMLNLLCIFDAVMLALMGKAGEPPPPPRAAPEAT